MYSSAAIHLTAWRLRARRTQAGVANKARRRVAPGKHLLRGTPSISGLPLAIFSSHYPNAPRRKQTKGCGLRLGWRENNVDDLLTLQQRRRHPRCGLLLRNVKQSARDHPPRRTPIVLTRRRSDPLRSLKRSDQPTPRGILAAHHSPRRLCLDQSRRAIRNFHLRSCTASLKGHPLESG